MAVGVLGGAVLVGVMVGGALRAVERPVGEQKTCVTAECHGDYQGQEFVHGPVALGDCLSCHRRVDPAEHTFALARQGEELCGYCHLERTAGSHVHEPVATGDCTACHDPHASGHRYMLEGEISSLCEQCHETDWKDAEHLHAPVAIGQCELCHDAHGSDYGMLLTREPETLCVYCHETTGNELARLEHVHEPVTQGCTGCHDPHGTDHAMVLKDSVPGLCGSCHEEVMTAAAGAKHRHEVVLEEGGCTQCHTPHASSVRYGLKAEPTRLCTECHDEAMTGASGGTLASFAAEVEGKAFRHGPVEQDDCKSCHNSHGSDHFRILNTEYPAEFYAPFAEENYALCFECHDSQLVQVEETAELTDFRDGKVNLHYVHVNRERGRTCRSCHATHASDLPKNMRESVPYGQWSLPVGFERTETGGSCASGCHLPKTYDRVSPVDYSGKTKAASAQ